MASKLYKDVENYNCKLCDRIVKNNQGLGQHVGLSHNIDLISYFYLYDSKYVKYKVCPVCGVKRSLTNMKERINCITCSKECDYKLKNKTKIKKNGLDYFSQYCLFQIDMVKC